MNKPAPKNPLNRRAPLGVAIGAALTSLMIGSHPTFAQTGNAATTSGTVNPATSAKPMSGNLGTGNPAAAPRSSNTGPAPVSIPNPSTPEPVTNTSVPYNDPRKLAPGTPRTSAPRDNVRASRAETRGPALDLDTYLVQVQTGNAEVKAAKESMEGAILRSNESRLLFVPTFSTQFQWVKDERKSPFLIYESFRNNVFDVGISEDTPWGVSASLGYNLTQTGYVGLGRPIYYYGSPKVEVAVDLWQNFRGRALQARATVMEAGRLANLYQQSFASKAVRAEAETAYIQLAAARAVYDVYVNSHQRAREIHAWNSRRYRMNLGEDSDVLQAEANIQAVELSLQTAEDQVRAAARNFNRIRGIDSDVVEERIVLPDPRDAVVPSRGEMRDDVRAAREQLRVAAANAEAGKEANKPILQLFGAYALNSQEVTSSDAMGKSFSKDDPTRMIGVRFQGRLSFSGLDTVKGYDKERIAAETLAEKRLFDQEVEWKDLVSRLHEAKARLAIAERLAQTQKKKAMNERTRLSRGRTTTYQSLIFDTDFNLAESQRIQAQSEVLLLLARMKTFGG